MLLNQLKEMALVQHIGQSTLWREYQVPRSLDQVGTVFKSVKGDARIVSLLKKRDHGIILFHFPGEREAIRQIADSLRKARQTVATVCGNVCMYVV